MEFSYKKKTIILVRTSHEARDRETPARKALTEFIKPVKKRLGRPKTTWLYQIYKELKNCNINGINFENERTMITG